jgi:MFS family permease
MTTDSAHQSNPDVNATRLFVGSCVALIATSVAFATVGAIMLALKREFILTNAEVGWIGGAALWGFAVSQVVFAPLADTLGMRFLLRMAFVGHLLGVMVMMVASGFWMLFAGALIIAMGNGLVEAACNPLVATLFPDNKTVKLNQFHVWFPGGVVIGGLASFGLDAVGIGAWQIKLALILVPTLAYGVMILTQPFPQTEGVQAGVSMGEMFKAAFTTPLMWVMLIAMAMTASVELGPNRWVPAVLEAGGMAGILVLVWINGLMAILRYRAGPVVERLSPTGVLVTSAVLSGAGLLSERVPRSGALGLGLMGTVGMATVGLVTSPTMGEIADRYAHEELPVAETIAVLQAGAQQLMTVEGPDAAAAMDMARQVLAAEAGSGSLPAPETANALRAITGTNAEVAAVAQAGAILGPADNYGGRISFRYVVPLCGVLMIIFGALYMRDKAAGGYQVTRIGDEA